MNDLSTTTPSSGCPDNEVCAGSDSDGKPSSSKLSSSEVSNNLDCDRFAVDPFTPIQDRKQLPPRPVVEIVQNLNGYRATKPTVEMLPVSETSACPSPSGSTGEFPRGANNCSHTPTPEPVFQLELKPLSSRFSIRSNASPSVTVTAQSQTAVAPVFSSRQTPLPTGATRFIAGGLPVAEIPIDIRAFSDNPVGEGGETDKIPEPIQGAFQLDPDFFEHHASLRGLTQLQALDQELSQLLVNEQHQIQPATDPSQILNSTQPDELAGVIYVRDKQIIFVDGNEGYQYIDLTCFDIKQASFQGNRIQIRHGHQDFEIEYRNLTHVMFADGQEVELANYDEDLIEL